MYMSYAYYSLMLAITLLFMKKDTIWFKFWIPDVKSGILKGLVAFPIFFSIGYIVNILFPVQLKVQDNVNVNSASVFLLITLVAPTVEEFMFRGYMQEYLRQRLKTEWTIVISGLIFSIFHPFVLFPQVFIAGIFMAYLREISGSILPGIVVHILNNLVEYMSAAFAR